MIKLLPDSVANQIAAGEVVNRPASVVKELMENAIDAGAGTVIVNFRDGGRELIQIKDDGVGMSPQDARMAFERHATSKITSVDDIYSLVTFGFRGEALPSIAAVAQVELQTRQQGQEVGTQLFIDGGTFSGQQPAATAKGTQIFVRNLFYNVPARKKFLDKGTTEASHVLTEFQRAALAHPEVAMELFRDDAPVYNLPAGGLHQRVAGIVGKAVAPKLLEVSVDTSIANVRGFIGGPQTARARTKDQFLFVNGRFFRSPFFHKAIIQAYEKLISHNVQPPYFIYLDIDPAQIDVNVHPQKTEVKFTDKTAVWQIVNAAVRETLAKSGAVPMMDFDAGERVEIPLLGGHAGLGFGSGSQGGGRGGHFYDHPMREPSAVRSPGYNPFAREDFGGREFSGGEFANSDFAGPNSAGHNFAGSDLVGGDIFAGEVRGFSHVIPLGEGYAAGIYGGRFVVVDLRRAREAVLYDRLETMLTAGRSATQSLLFPERLVFSTDDFQLLGDNADEFSALGFDIRPAGEHTVEIFGVPSDVTAESVDEVVYGILDALRDGVFEGEEQRRRHLAAVMARSGSSAARASRISVAEIEVLLSALCAVKNSGFTPSGKPVMAEISVDEIRDKLR